MNPARMQKILVVLLAALSLCTTLLIVLAFVRTRTAAAQGPARAGLSQAAGQAGNNTSLPPASNASPTQNQPAAIIQGGSDDDQTGAAPPVLFPAPPFNLIESSGKPLGLNDLQGKVWIADFIFTQCGSICPRMTSVMNTLQTQLAKRPDWGDIRLVSFSVDPDHDTPAVLRDYAKLFEAQPGHWFFLTGDRKIIWPLIRKGFKLSVEGDAGNSSSPVLHSGKFVLIDRAGRIRGYYDGLDTDGRTKLLAALDHVLGEKN